MADSTWLILREQGALVEEADDNGEGGEGMAAKFDEKDMLVEKIGLHLQNIDIGAGTELSNVDESDNDGTRKEIKRGILEVDPLTLR
jgi:hypothetical protein